MNRTQCLRIGVLPLKNKTFSLVFSAESLVVLDLLIARYCRSLHCVLAHFIPRFPDYLLSVVSSVRKSAPPFLHISKIYILVNRTQCLRIGVLPLKNKTFSLVFSAESLVVLDLLIARYCRSLHCVLAHFIPRFPDYLLSVVSSVRKSAPPFLHISKIYILVNRTQCSIYATFKV